MKRNITPHIGMSTKARRYMKEKTSIPPKFPPIEAMIESMTTSISGNAMSMSTYVSDDSQRVKEPLDGESAFLEQVVCYALEELLHVSTCPDDSCEASQKVLVVCRGRAFYLRVHRIDDIVSEKVDSSNHIRNLIGEHELGIFLRGGSEYSLRGDSGGC